jgi:hypothetical protein
LRASAQGYASNEVGLRAWFAAGADAGIGLWLTSKLALGVRVGASAPLVRQVFVLNEAPVFSSPAVTAELGIGIKLRIW